MTWGGSNWSEVGRHIILTDHTVGHHQKKRGKHLTVSHLLSVILEIKAKGLVFVDGPSTSYKTMPYWTSIHTKTKLRGLSPQANYIDRATAAVGEVVPTFADRGVLRGQRNGSPRPLISIF
jgi:hypothetical protein